MAYCARVKFGAFLAYVLPNYGQWIALFIIHFRFALCAFYVHLRS